MTKRESLQQELDSLNRRLWVLSTEIEERIEQRSVLVETRATIMRWINEALREELRGVYKVNGGRHGQL